jgi:hypothetical protein
MRSFDPIHRWRDAHRVLLRNPYADIGLTCLDGQAAVWIGERIDRDYRIRCEWSDVSGPPRLARQHRADFRGLCRAPRLCPHRQPSISLGSKPPDRVPSGDPMSRLPTSGEWREGSLCRTTADWPFHWVAEITAMDPLSGSYTCIGTVGRPEPAVMTRRWPTCGSHDPRPQCSGSCKLSRRCST